MNWLGRVLFRLSQSPRLKQFTLRFPPARRVVQRFVAGETLPEALSSAKALHQQGFTIILNHLGEEVKTEEEVSHATAEYIRLLEAIHSEFGTGRENAPSTLPAYISIKLSHLGLDISEDLCEKKVEEILRKARDFHLFVCIDMESSAYTDRTLKLHQHFYPQFAPHLGLVIQAMLYRSTEDIARLTQSGANIRLVKGAYLEPPTLAFQRKKDVDANYRLLMERLLAPEIRQKGAYIAVATHDSRMIEEAKALLKKNGLLKQDVEFQFLYGVRRDLQKKLLQEGFPVRIYIPYGEAWYPYLMRRLAERPANLFFFLKHLFQG